MSRWPAYEWLAAWHKQTEDDPEATLTLSREQVQAILFQLMKGIIRDNVARGLEEQDRVALEALRAHPGDAGHRAAVRVKGWHRVRGHWAPDVVLEYLCFLHGVPPLEKHSPEEAVRAVAERKGFPSAEAARRYLSRARHEIQREPDGETARGARAFGLFSREAVRDFAVPGTLEGR